MFTVIYSKDELKKYRSLIDNLYNSYGKIYLQNYLSLEAVFFQKKQNDFFVFIDNNENIISAFERKIQDVWQCNFNGYPFLCRGNIELKIMERYLSNVKKQLKAKVLYFPQVYMTDIYTKYLLKIDNCYHWNRLPSPIINRDYSEDIIWKRLISRYDSRAEKQKKFFEKNLSCKILTDNNYYDQIARIEINSWKRSHHQDMLSRDNQIVYYSHIVESGLANITFAYNSEDVPIAFRIDAISNNILYVIKWSYDENFKKYSPGFYLLTVDLFRSYKGRRFKFIDLYGSPDLLKNLIENDRLKRIDVCFSKDADLVNSIKKNRISYDRKALNNYKKKQSIRKIFN